MKALLEADVTDDEEDVIFKHQYKAQYEQDKPFLKEITFKELIEELQTHSKFF